MAWLALSSGAAKKGGQTFAVAQKPELASTFRFRDLRLYKGRTCLCERSPVESQARLSLLKIRIKLPKKNMGGSIH